MTELPANSEKPEDRLARLLPATLEPRNPAGQPPNERRCTGISKGGGRCVAWAITGESLCAGHAGISLEAARAASAAQAEARREARLSVRERAAQALDDDWPDVLAALRRGIKDPDARKASQTAVSYVQLVFGRQLHQQADEAPAPADDLASMPRAERDRLKRELLAEHPELAQRLRLAN